LSLIHDLLPLADVDARRAGRALGLMLGTAAGEAMITFCRYIAARTDGTPTDEATTVKHAYVAEEPVPGHRPPPHMDTTHD
jgi:hypothetical protein